MKQKLYAKMKDGNILRVINYDYMNERFTYITLNEEESKKTKSFDDVEEFTFKNNESLLFKKGDILQSTSFPHYNSKFIVDDSDIDLGYKLSQINVDGSRNKMSAFDSAKYVENNFEKIGER